MSKLPSYSEVRQAAQNVGWDNIVRRYTSALDEALSKMGSKVHVKCPLPSHGGADDFRLNKDFPQKGYAICSCSTSHGIDVFEMLQQLGVFSSAVEARNAIAKDLGLIDGAPASTTRPKSFTPPPRPVAEEDVKEKAEKSRKRSWWQGDLWDQALTLDHPDAAPARKYFEKRGIPLASPFPVSIRFYAKGMEWKVGGEEGGTWPVILINVTKPNGERCTLHRIFIDFNGDKAQVKKAKMLLPSIEEGTLMGSAIRLETVGNCTTLNLAEGPETAYGVFLLTKETTWSCISERGLREVKVPRFFKKVRIWADQDAKHAGGNAATVLASRLMGEGFEVSIVIPKRELLADRKSIDWLDLINEAEMLDSAKPLRDVADLSDASGWKLRIA